MKRLVDDVENVVAGENRRLTRLVRQAEPFRPNPFSKRRVLLRLKAPGSGRSPLVRPSIVAAAIVFTVGSALAGRGWWRARHDIAPAGVEIASKTSIRASQPSTPAASQLSLPVASQPSLPAVPVRDEPSRVTEAPVAHPGPAAPDTAGPSTAPRGHGSKRRSGAGAEEPVAPHGAATGAEDPAAVSHAGAGGEDPTAVVRAIRALRSEQNPARAELLLQEYLRAHPHGALAEDAVALLIETATAQRSASAPARAARYLQLYPRGRYRATAERALASRK